MRLSAREEQTTNFVNKPGDRNQQVKPSRTEGINRTREVGYLGSILGSSAVSRTEGKLQQLMEETVDDYQNFKAKGGAYP